MSVVKDFKVNSLDIENLLELKVSLNRSSPPDPVLQSNLKFAIAAMEARPAAMKKNSELLVEGECTAVRISAGCPRRWFTVFEGPKGLRLYQKVQFRRALNKNDIDEAYFIGHRCPRAISCSDQARDALSSQANVEIKVFCKELRLTLTPPQPEKTIKLPKKNWW